MVCTAHRHLSNIDCLMVHTACLVCFISTVNSHSKKEEKKSIKTGASSGHITNVKQSILESFDIYGRSCCGCWICQWPPQLKQAHLLTCPVCLVGQPALFVPAISALIQLKWILSSRSGCMLAMKLLSSVATRPNSQLKTQLKQLLDTLPLDIPAYTSFVHV